MSSNPKITFIGAGSSVFMKNIVGDVLQREALAGRPHRLMDINPQRLEESAIIAGKLINQTLGVPATVKPSPTSARRSMAPTSSSSASRSAATNRRRSPISRCPRSTTCARPSPTPRGRRHHARPPHRAAPVEDLRGHARGLPRGGDAAIRQPDGYQHLGHFGEVPDHQAGRPLPLGAGHGDGTGPRPRDSLFRGNPLSRSPASTTWRSTSSSNTIRPTAPIANLYPDLRPRLSRRTLRPSRAGWNPRCPNNTVRYEMLTRLGYFVTESSEHFAEYTPYFIKEGREDLIEKFGIPLDEYPKRCIEQIAKLEDRGSRRIQARPTPSRSSRAKEYASSIMNSEMDG